MNKTLRLAPPEFGSKLCDASHRFAPRAVCTALLMAAIFFSMPSMAAPPSLPDQYGNESGMKKFTGQPVIVFVTSLSQLPNLGKWEEAIRPEVPHMNSMDIGDIDTTSGMTKALVVKELKKHVPDGVSVYIDAENLWAKEYSLDLGEPCVLLFDEEHNLVTSFRGKPKDELLDQVTQATRELFPTPEQTSAMPEHQIGASHNFIT